MNDKKICIICCVNDEDFFSECLMYIDRLIIPEGYEIEVISIEDAKSMTAGYNEAMKSSDAKYKIYIHQDTFIVDKYIIQELIDVFINNPQIGMIGVAGTPNMPADACMWNSKRVSTLYGAGFSDIQKCNDYSNIGSYEIVSVEAIDGLFMATQYDLPWREDLFTEFDFYDASQSMEFIKKGYQVVVPLFDKPVCVHDDGEILNLINYDENRKKYLKEYRNN